VVRYWSFSWKSSGYAEIARRYGRRPSAVTMACRSIERELGESAKLAEKLAEVREVLTKSEK